MRSRARLAAILAIGAISALPAPGASAMTRLEHAQQCAAEMGTIPGFNCMDGQTIPITVNGVAQTQPVAACDKPVQLGLVEEGQCVPYARFLRLSTGVSTVETVAICRKYHKSTGPDDATFHDIAMIQHNKATGHTCYFQSPVDVPHNGLTVPSPSDSSAQASTYWLEPPSVAIIHCTGCHSADPFIWSPYVIQVADPTHWNPLGKWDSNFLNLFGTAAQTFKPTGNLCTSCHRMGSGNDCGGFMLSYTVGPKSNTTAPQNEFWMPPNFGTNAAAWHSTFDTSFDQLKRCCSTPSLPECNTVTAGCANPENPENLTDELMKMWPDPQPGPFLDASAVAAFKTCRNDKIASGIAGVNACSSTEAQATIDDINGTIYEQCWSPAVGTIKSNICSSMCASQKTLDYLYHCGQNCGSLKGTCLADCQSGKLTGKFKIKSPQDLADQQLAENLQQCRAICDGNPGSKACQDCYNNAAKQFKNAGGGTGSGTGSGIPKLKQ
jgi:hypothetical protein